MEKRLKLLSSMPVFGGLNAAAVTLIGDLTESVRVPAGEHFFHEGDNSQTMYVLQSGRVEIYKTWHSATKLLRYMDAGDCFGEMALIDLLPRSASALAVEPCEALQVTPSILHELYQHDLEQFTMLQMNMGREVSRRLRELDDSLFRAYMGEAITEDSLSGLV